MRGAEKLWNAVDERMAASRAAAASMERADQAKHVLDSLDAHFAKKFRDLIEVMLNCPDAELVRWRAATAATLDYYTELVATVTAGDVAARRLAEQANKEE